MNKKHKEIVLEHYKIVELSAVDYRIPMVGIDYARDGLNKKVIDVSITTDTRHVDHLFFGAIHNALHAFQGHIMYEPKITAYFIDKAFQEASEDMWERLYEHIKPENFSELHKMLKQK